MAFVVSHTEGAFGKIEKQTFDLSFAYTWLSQTVHQYFGCFKAVSCDSVGAPLNATFDVSYACDEHCVGVGELDDAFGRIPHLRLCVSAFGRHA